MFQGKNYLWPLPGSLRPFILRADDHPNHHTKIYTDKNNADEDIVCDEFMHEGKSYLWDPFLNAITDLPNGNYVGRMENINGVIKPSFN